MSRSIRLSDGTLLELKVNFLTMKIFQDEGIGELYKKMKKNPNDNALKFEILSKFIYALVRSSGRKVDEEEAMSLIELENEEDINNVVNAIEEFAKKIDKFKKKPASNVTRKKKK